MLRCYLIGGSQDTHHDPDEFLTKVEAAMQAGITAFQYREKGPAPFQRRKPWRWVSKSGSWRPSTAYRSLSTTT